MISYSQYFRLTQTLTGIHKPLPKAVAPKDFQKVLFCMCMRCSGLTAADAVPDTLVNLDLDVKSVLVTLIECVSHLSAGSLIFSFTTNIDSRVCYSEMLHYYRGSHCILLCLIYLKYNLFLRTLIFHPSML